MTEKELATYNALAKKIADTKTPFAKGDRLELFWRIVFNFSIAGELRRQANELQSTR
jgi:hypothetical protein